MTKQSISLIVAALQPELGIGMGGKLPWRLKQEIKYFRDVTCKSEDGYLNAVVMGRKTWESIPVKFRPLPGRLNVVLSRSYANIMENGVFFSDSISSALQKLRKSGFQHEGNLIDKIYVIGGAEIYNTLITDSCVDNLLITELNFVGDEAKQPAIDTFLNWDLSQWEKQSVTELERFTGIEFQKGAVHEGDYEYEFTLWRKKSSVSESQ